MNPTDTNAAFIKAIGEAKPLLVEFYSRKEVRNMEDLAIMDNLRAKFGDQANIITVNGDEDTTLVEKYHVHSYPTWILFKDGQEAWRDGGRKPESELTDMIRRFK